MKILCLQLTRPGDIFQTLPTLNGLRRSYPGAAVDFLVREKFASVIPNLGEGVRVLSCPVDSFVEPLLRDHASRDTALERMGSWIDGLRLEAYDLIVNLSFSPFSSYLVSEIAADDSIIRGYSRTSDGFLEISDDSSAYFFAQGGVARPNRIHISDVFGMVAGLDLIEEDFQAFDESKPYFSDGKPYVVIHVGASSAEKTLSKEAWRDLATAISDSLRVKIVFVGVQTEAISMSQSLRNEIFDLCGRTTVPELIQIISHAALVVGGDSLGVQIASLTDTLTLNLSCAAVNFWETGPRASHSVILWAPTVSDFSINRIANVVEKMLAATKLEVPHFRRETGFGMIYSAHGYQLDDWEWDVTRAIYLGQDYPRTTNRLTVEGFRRLAELADLGIEQIGLISNPRQRQIAMTVLNEIDELVRRILVFSPELSPVVRWFQTEKSRIPPGTIDQVLLATKSAFDRLKEFCSAMIVNATIAGELGEGTTWR